MVDPGLVLSGLSLMYSRQASAESRRAAESLENGEPADDAPADVKENQRITNRQDKIIDQLDALHAIEAKTKPSPGDKDAFASATVSLNPDETVLVTVEPQTGFNLRVKSIEFDRRDNHSYEFNVGGDLTSVSHRAKYVSPKKVSQGDRVIAQATNNSNSGTTIDFEMIAWAEKP